MGTCVSALPWTFLLKKEEVLDKKNRYDVIIVGSGAAGGTLVFELSRLRPDLKILLIEKGGEVKKGEDGKFWPFFRKHYRKFVLGSRSKEGVVIYAGEMLGGTTVISCGNMCRSEILEERLRSLDVPLSDFLAKAEIKMGVKPLPEARIIAGSRIISEAAKELDFTMSPMPKAINGLCIGCGQCVKGCALGAKWDTRTKISFACQNINLTVMANTQVREVINSYNGYGVRLDDGREIISKIVVLAAGALATPKILFNSERGEAGEGLSIHPFDVVYGRMESGPGQLKGLTMATYLKLGEDIMLSPFIDEPSQIPFTCGIKWWLKNPLAKTLGIMVKVADPESKGYISPNGDIHYEIPTEARTRLRKGIILAREILKKAGAREFCVTSDFPRGAHPQGTAKIGEVVDNNLRLYSSKGIYVSDASVIPLATGTPPILTIVALNLRLAQHLKTVL